MEDQDTNDISMDWIDEALKKGMGFKSEEERKKYIESLGDPELHPMFARNTNELIGNPLADGIRALREEGKTDIELSIMYKDEGNELLKNGDHANADSKYAYALTFLDNANNEVTSNGIHLGQLRSQIFSNQALICLNRKNYKTTIELSDKALSHWSMNMKAHYRKCKSLLMLRRFENCIDACEAAIKLEPNNNKDFLQFITSSNEGIQRTKDLEREKEVKAMVTRRKFENTFEIIKKLENQTNSKISLGFGNAVKVAQLKDIYPSYNSTDSAYQWPLLFLYPQYNQLDVIPDASVDALLVEYLANMFPEYDDGNVESPGWDLYHEFSVSKLVVYIMLHSSPVISTKEEWVQNCLEERIINGMDNNQMTAQEGLQQLQQRQINYEQIVKIMYNKQVECRYVEIDLGCNILQVLNIPNHVLSGGVCNFLIYSKGNASHQKFLKSVADDANGFTKIGVYGPNTKGIFDIVYKPL